MKALDRAGAGKQNTFFQSLVEELYEENWDVSDSVADLREMTDEHIRIIVQTSQKDGIENQHVKKVDICLDIKIQIHPQCRNKGE